jgi:hypothetical protein
MLAFHVKRSANLAVCISLLRGAARVRMLVHAPAGRSVTCAPIGRAIGYQYADRFDDRPIGRHVADRVIFLQIFKNA